jgi:hypothetical protein
MKTKRNNKTLLAFAFGAGALLTALILRGAAPELYRYMRIRRM